tara:strand:+ start:4694 stop:5632 length:939 start_codon:yes stop_codon:yes gene_type:complete
MKISPLNILFDKGFSSDKKIYFISGNEITLMQKIKSVIIEEYNKNEKVSVKKINSIDDFVDEFGLFEDKRLCLVENSKTINIEKLNKIKNSSTDFIFVQENSQKIKKLKSIILKDKDSYLIDCYDLDRDSKIKILNHFINLNKLEIDKNIYWALVEKLDNKYGFLENDLLKILDLKSKDMNINNIKKILTVDDTGKDVLFFYLFRKNREIVELYRDKIITPSDVNELYYYCRFYCQLIIECKNLEEYNKKIPVYLFKEKNFLLNIYKKYNSKKKKLLLNLLSSTEKILRKDSSLSIIFGLRFLLNIKKITIS